MVRAYRRVRVARSQRDRQLVRRRYLPEPMTKRYNMLSRSVYKNRSDRPFMIKRSTRSIDGVTQLSNQSGTDTFWGFNFKLSDLPNYSEFGSLFDNYMIRCVVIKLIPVKNQINTSVSGTVEIPTIGVVWDYDDSNAPSSMDTLRQYATYREYASNQPITLKVYPKVSLAAYQSGAFSGYLRPTPKLQKMFRLDVANPAIEHYGIKIGIPTSGLTTGAITYDIHATYYMRFSGLI